MFLNTFGIIRMRTITDIIKHLQTFGVTSTRKTIAADIEELQHSGFDIVRNKSR